LLTTNAFSAMRLRAWRSATPHTSCVTGQASAAMAIIITCRASLAEHEFMLYVLAIEFRPNDLASPRKAACLTIFILNLD
jgi:hypothetical protein